MTAEAEAVLEFWFADAARRAAARERQMKLWFGEGASEADIRAQDELIRCEFGAVVDAATRGALSEWQASPRGRLALIILLDQFRRAIFRGTAEAFASDAAALELATQGMAIGADRVLGSLERLFFFMPLQHSESFAVQERSLSAFGSLANEASGDERSLFESCLEFARLHHDIVRRFGRFPHRNAILGRASTPAELAYLASDAPDFGQKK